MFRLQLRFSDFLRGSSSLAEADPAEFQAKNRELAIYVAESLTDRLLNRLPLSARSATGDGLGLLDAIRGILGQGRPQKAFGELGILIK